jgi:50S ribosomal protein L23
MKQLKSSLLVVATLALLSACSADDEKKKYTPAVASSVESTVYVEVRDGGEVSSPSTLLYDGRFSVFGKASGRTLSVSADKLDDVKVYRFSADLPDQSVMKYWDTDEGKRGEGYADVVITIDRVKVPLRFHYRYSAIPNAEKMLGGTSIVIKMVEWQGKTIDPYLHNKHFKIVLRKQEQGYSVE